jgi:hypothetical protein
VVRFFRANASALALVFALHEPAFCQSTQSAISDAAPLPEPAPLQTSDALTPPTADIPASADLGMPPPSRSPEPAVELVQPVEGISSPTFDLPRWRFDVRLETSLTYDDNIFIQPNNKQADFYFGITPLIAVGWGAFQADPTIVTGVGSRFPQVAARDVSGNAFLFRYAPTALLFVHHRDQDAVNEDVMLSGRWVTDKLTMEASGRFQTLSAPDIDVGNRINSEVTSGLLNANYQMTQRTSIDARFALERDSYQGGLDSTDLEFSALLNYQLLPKTMVGLGAGLGYTTIEDGENQYYEQGLLHLRWEPTAKLSFEGTVGLEVREISSGPDRTTPVFEFGANYALADSTSVRLSASRRIETSALFLDQDIERTTVEASIRQRFLHKIYVTASGGFEHLDYVDAGAAANRTDSFGYFGLESAWEVTKFLSLKASYRYENDHSTNGDFSFRRNLADLQCNIQF